VQAKDAPLSTKEAMPIGKVAFHVPRGVNPARFSNLVQVALIKLIEAIEASRGSQTRPSVSEAQSRWFTA